MTNWVYPLGTAADGTWDVSIGTSDSTLSVDGWAHTGLKVATLAAGTAVELPAADEERIVVPLNGAFTVTVDGTEYPLAGRASVFAGPSDVLYYRHGAGSHHQLGRRRPGRRRDGPGQGLTTPPGW